MFNIPLVLSCLLLDSSSGRFSRSVKDPERLEEEARRKPVKEGRIMTPSRVMLPPHTPHFIYFNPSDLREEEEALRSPVRPPTPEAVREEVVLSPVPVVCLKDPSIQVCEYDETSYPHSMISTILDTFSAEMRLLLKYVKPTMLVSDVLMIFELLLFSSRNPTWQT